VTPALGRALERFVLPNACVACDRAVPAHEPDALVCGVCRTRLRTVPEGCGRCGQPLPPIGPCRFCRDWDDALDRARSAVWLDAPARAMVHHLKYDSLPGLGTDIGAVMTRRLPRPAGGILVPVPLARPRHRARGYNQAAAIARALGLRWRVPVREALLSRIRDTATQTALTPEARAANVAHAFAARAAGRRSAPVILVDDVLTTGATLVAAARALREAGWPAVTAVTFARALPYDLRAAG